MIQKTIFASLLMLGVGLFFHSEFEKYSRNETSIFDVRTENREKPIEENSSLVKTKAVFSHLLGYANTEKNSVLSREEAKAKWKNIQNLHGCWTKQECNIQLPDSTPNESSFYVRDLILDEIDGFLEKSVENEDQIAQTSRAVELLISLPDDMIRSRALDLAAQLPPNPNLVDMIAAEIIPELIDVELTEKVVKEFDRQLKEKTGKEETILRSMEEVILHGGNFASKEMARLAPTILSERDRPLVQKWLSNLPPNSERYRLLAHN